MDINLPSSFRLGIIVAHPDDETLWAGGYLLMHPAPSPFIATLCRASDPDRAPRFDQVVQRYNGRGKMADLDDGPEQTPLAPELVETSVLALLEDRSFDLLLTHSPRGEYTRHRRHEETARAVASLWKDGRLNTKELRLFAYDDEDRAHLPTAIPDADLRLPLPTEIWEAKRRILREIYGFAEESWEYRTCPAVESFWRFDSPESLEYWMLTHASPK